MAASKIALKPLTAAPTVSPLFVFKNLFTRKSFAKTIIDEMNTFSKKGSSVACLYFGSKRLAVATHPDTVKEIIRNPDVFQKAARLNMHQNNPISRFYANSEDGFHPDLVTSNGETWKNLRSKFGPAFAKDALDNMIPSFHDQSVIFADKCGQSQTVDVVEATSQYALDCLGTALIGAPFGAQSGKFQDLCGAYDRVMLGFGDPINNFWPKIFDLPLRRNKEYSDAVDTVKAFLADELQKKLDQRAHGVSTPNSLLDSILDVTDESFPVDGILPNLFVFLVAGHDTTAVSLAWVLNVLARDEEIQDEARAEIHSVLNNADSAPTKEQLDDLVFVDAILKENLRLNPPIHNVMTREASEDTELGGYFIPKGTGISLAVEAINKCEDSWQKPESFNPHRYQKGNTRKNKLYSYMPFSVGPRRCIGDKFSILEQKCLLATILTKYTIKPVESGAQEPPLSNGAFSFLFKQPVPFNLEFVPRT